MPLGDTMEAMHASLQSSLDDLVSPRASPKAQLKALESIEKTLAQALFIMTNDSEAKFCFAALQAVPAHLLSWIIKTTAKLEIITNKGLMDAGQTSEAEDLASHLALSLSLLQGTVLNHEPSKIYLGRKPAIETLLDLLLVSCHLSTPQESAESKARSTPNWDCCMKDAVRHFLPFLISTNIKDLPITFVSVVASDKELDATDLTFEETLECVPDKTAPPFFVKSLFHLCIPLLQHCHTWVHGSDANGLIMKTLVFNFYCCRFICRMARLRSDECDGIYSALKMAPTLIIGAEDADIFIWDCFHIQPITTLPDRQLLSRKANYRYSKIPQI
ncbi:hypothetical protein HYPSUDRAFT_220417 [Hypholoma sublateritium FD-334 SS-4]|uniref:Uncharacterized protein n=1 Tax=Hypholoma sublateritium (strain FD-334 SS-4) TaxID=945553 RepID=A0A0D2P1W5_HYPSF|nr:hypothetical protein HYPSUDRAFT_220417 [Hypholoma sublateritium FD-334 SS-4]